MLELPTHLRVEDRPFFGRTAGEAAILAAGFLVVISAWGLVDLPTSWRLGITAAVAILCLLAVWVRPAGRRVPTWLAILVAYRAAPKRARWCRTPLPADDERKPA